MYSLVTNAEQSRQDGCSEHVYNPHLIPCNDHILEYRFTEKNGNGNFVSKYSLVTNVEESHQDGCPECVYNPHLIM